MVAIENLPQRQSQQIDETRPQLPSVPTAETARRAATRDWGELRAPGDIPLPPPSPGAQRSLDMDAPPTPRCRSPAATTQNEFVATKASTPRCRSPAVASARDVVATTMPLTPRHRSPSVSSTALNELVAATASTPRCRSPAVTATARFVLAGTTGSTPRHRSPAVSSTALTESTAMTGSTPRCRSRAAVGAAVDVLVAAMASTPRHRSPAVSSTSLNEFAAATGSSPRHRSPVATSTALPRPRDEVAASQLGNRSSTAVSLVQSARSASQRVGSSGPMAAAGAAIVAGRGSSPRRGEASPDFGCRAALPSPRKACTTPLQQQLSSSSHAPSRAESPYGSTTPRRNGARAVSEASGPPSSARAPSHQSRKVPCTVPPLSARGAPPALPTVGAIGGSSGSRASSRSARGRSEDPTSSGRAAASCTRKTYQAPDYVMQELHRTLKLLRVGFKQASPTVVTCEKKGVRFDVQVSPAGPADAEPAHMVKLQRVNGEVDAYRELCAKVFAESQL
mmetsp:Transcript_181461/g.576025  ORF Transcript_181461/g.576025 Transcript_181461/m.576025 type:complete len:509 (-) Transcript_181461:61-1587(-)